MQEQEVQKENRGAQDGKDGTVQASPAPTPTEAPAGNPAAWRSPPWTAPAWNGWTVPAAPAATPRPALHPAWPGARGAPKCDIADEGAEFVCQIELPGVRPEDVEVVSFERALLVDAPRGAAPETHGGVLLQAERAAGVPVHRTIALPEQVRPSAVSATLRDGVLTVRLPKAEPAEPPCRIDVSA